MKAVLSMVDAACGAMEWMPAALRAYGHQRPDFRQGADGAPHALWQHTPCYSCNQAYSVLGRYLGLDVARPVIASAAERFGNESQWSFAVHDFTAGPPPQAGLIFCRDALQHLPLAQVGQRLRHVLYA